MQTTKMKKKTYLSTEKMVTTMNQLKVAVLLAAFAAMPVCLRAQSEGVGTTDPQATLHVHCYTEDVQPPVPPIPLGDGLNSVGDEIHFPLSYTTTLLLTNTNTGTSAYDGLLIKQSDLEVLIKQQEAGDFKIVNSNSTGKFIMTSTGNFGIGNVSEGIKFNVAGNARFTGAVNMLSGLSVSGALTVGNTLTCSSGASFAGTVSMLSGLNVAGVFTVGSGFSCDASGNLKVKHLKVTLTDWPDYVFGGDHALMPLGELEAYIGEHQHLPGIPTAAEVEQEGADLGEMNRLLMEKVEELTLYIIDLQKQIDEMKSNQ